MKDNLSLLVKGNEAEIALVVVFLSGVQMMAQNEVHNMSMLKLVVNMNDAAMPDTFYARLQMLSQIGADILNQPQLKDYLITMTRLAERAKGSATLEA